MCISLTLPRSLSFARALSHADYRHAIVLAAQMTNQLLATSHIDPKAQAALRASASMNAQGDAILDAACLRIGIENESDYILNMKT